MLQSETGGADGQTYSLCQDNSSVALQTSTDLEGFDMVTAVRRLAEQEHSAALAQLGSRISAIMKFGAGADDDPFVQVKVIMDLISLLQAEASSEANQKSYCDEETSKTTEKKEDLEADVAKHSSKHEAAVARSIVLDGEISTLQSELSVLLNRQLQMDIMCGVERYILDKVTADLDRHRLQQRNVEQTINTLATSLAEMIGEVPVIQTQGKTQQGVNTQVQHVVNTVEVETPKIVKEAVRGKKVIREKINQFAEHIKNPQTQFSNKVDEMPVFVQRQNTMVQTAQKTNEIPQLRCTDEVVDNPVVQVPRVQVAERTVEIPQLQTVEKIDETPQTQTIQGTQTPESLGITPVCQVEQTGHVEELVEVSRVFSQDTKQFAWEV